MQHYVHIGGQMRCGHGNRTWVNFKNGHFHNIINGDHSRRAPRIQRYAKLKFFKSSNSDVHKMAKKLKVEIPKQVGGGKRALFFLNDLLTNIVCGGIRKLFKSILFCTQQMSSDVLNSVCSLEIKAKDP